MMLSQQVCEWFWLCFIRQTGQWQTGGVADGTVGVSGDDETHLTPAEKDTTGKKSPSELKFSNIPWTGWPLMRKEMLGALRSRQQLTTSSARSTCWLGELTERATQPANHSTRYSHMAYGSLKKKKLYTVNTITLRLQQAIRDQDECFFIRFVEMCLCIRECVYMHPLNTILTILRLIFTLCKRNILI